MCVLVPTCRTATMPISAWSTKWQCMAHQPAKGGRGQERECWEGRAKREKLRLPKEGEVRRGQESLGMKEELKEIVEHS